MKKIILILLIFLMSILPAYSMTCAFVIPTTGGFLTNLSRINVSFSNPGTTEATITVNVTAASASTRNTSNALIFRRANESGASISADLSINSSIPQSAIIEDANNYVLTCSCLNSTATTACDATVTDILIDQNLPYVPTGVTYTSPVRDTNTITTTIDLAYANRCFIKFGGNPRVLMSISGSTCTYTATRGTNNPPDGDYRFVVIADDLSNSTPTLSNVVTIDADQSGDSGYLSNTQVTVPSGSPVTSAGGAFSNLGNNKIAVLIILVLAFLYFKNKK